MDKSIIFSVDKLEEIITASNFEALVGEVENDWFECKGQKYDLEKDVGKRELAKDISSFANLQGGYILIGIKTKTSDTHFGDEIEELRPFPLNLLKPEQYQLIIKNWVYPEIEGVTIRWVPIKNGESKGIVVIKIPRQKESLKPFIIKNVLDDKKKCEIMFGYAERIRDNSQPLSVVDLQRALRSGFNYNNNINERFSSLETLLNQLTNHSLIHSNEKGFSELIDERIEFALEVGNIKQNRALILTVYPSSPSELKTIFNSSEGSILRRLENPPNLRYSGWSLSTRK